MANVVYRLDITTADPSMSEKITGISGTKWEVAKRLSNYFKGLSCGSNTASVAYSTNASAAAASATGTIATVIATNTVVIGSVTFTGTDGTPGATGFQTGTTDDLSRDSIIAKVNANTTSNTYVTASKAGVKASGTLTCLGAVAGNAPHCGATTFTAVAPTATATTIQWNIPNYFGICAFDAVAIDTTHIGATVTLASWTNIWTENNWIDAIGSNFDAYLDGTTVWTIDNSNAALTLISVDPVNRYLVFSGNSTDVAALVGDTCYLYPRGYYNANCAANLAAAINRNVTQNALVVATSALGVVTIQGLDYGTTANAYTLTSGTNVTRSGATLAGGTCVFKITANQMGGVGNTLVFSSTGGTITCTGSGYLAGGVDPTAVGTYSYGQ